MNKNIADVLIFLSAVTAIIAGYVSFTQNNLLELAGTQWMLIAIVLGIYALYAKARVAA